MSSLPLNRKQNRPLACRHVVWDDFNLAVCPHGGALKPDMRQGRIVGDDPPQAGTVFRCGSITNQDDLAQVAEIVLLSLLRPEPFVLGIEANQKSVTAIPVISP